MKHPMQSIVLFKISCDKFQHRRTEALDTVAVFGREEKGDCNVSGNYHVEFRFFFKRKVNFRPAIS
jgi:hypothetical protein